MLEERCFSMASGVVEAEGEERGQASLNADAGPDMKLTFRAVTGRFVGMSSGLFKHISLLQSLDL